LTSANAILGQGQMSLAKYLLIVAREDDPDLDIHAIPSFLRHLLERVDWTTDLHFQTRTTIDTLDYSGHGFNQGSKVVIAAAGPKRRSLTTEIASEIRLPEGFSKPRVVLPGILAIRGPRYQPTSTGEPSLETFCRAFTPADPINTFPMIVLVDDSEFTARSERNFLWVTFTRSNPAADLDGIGAFTHQKHWGCEGSVVIDARIKPHHAPPLVDDPEIERRVDELGAPGGALHGII
jgi:4-hydroxy-3-polyprenylbenzoate decarboxylase